MDPTISRHAQPLEFPTGASAALGEAKLPNYQRLLCCPNPTALGLESKGWRIIILNSNI